MSDHTTRRNFLKLATIGGAAAITGAQAAGAADEPADSPPPLPTRPLGKTGLDVSMLALGGSMQAHSPAYLDIAWQLGIRYFDTSIAYLKGQSEVHIGQWLEKYPERRKDLVLVTKDKPFQGGPRQLLEQIDQRLAVLKTDYVDIFFLHGIGSERYGQKALEWPRSKEFREVAEKLRASGKCKFVGFSCHEDDRHIMMQRAVEGGFIDAIMVKYSSLLDKGDDLNKALDACHQAGIGLISMKEGRSMGEMPKRLPQFDELGLTTYQALLHSVWSDERLSSICSYMASVQELTDNTLAARLYRKPMAPEKKELLRDFALNFGGGAGLCANCDGRCRKACGTPLALSDITRFVNYYESDGNLEARQFYHALPPERRATSGADLSAARCACLANLDFEEILRRADQYFA